MQRSAFAPAAVGVDIGCGMAAVRTPWSVAEVRGTRVAGAAAGRHRRRAGGAAVGEAVQPDASPSRRCGASWSFESWPRARRSHTLGGSSARPPTGRSSWAALGSGNHFIEVTADEQDRVWLFLHSGSRGVGNKIAMRHIAIAAQAGGTGAPPPARPRPGVAGPRGRRSSTDTLNRPGSSGGSDLTRRLSRACTQEVRRRRPVTGRCGCIRTGAGTPGESKLAGPPRGGRAAGHQAGHAAELDRAGRDRRRRRGRASTTEASASSRLAAGERRAAPGERDPQDGVGVFRRGGARPPTAVIVRLHRRATGTASGSSRSARCSPSTACRSPRAPTTPVGPRRSSAPTGRRLRGERPGRPVAGQPRASMGPASCGTPPARAGHRVRAATRSARLMRHPRDRRRAPRPRTHASPPGGTRPAPRHPDLVNRAWTHADPAGPVVGRRLHLRVDLAGFVYVALRHRRVLPPDPGLAGRDSQDDHRWSSTRWSRRCSPAGRGDAAFTATGLVHHSDAGSQGGLNRSSQHL